MHRGEFERWTVSDWYEKQTIGLLPERAARRFGAREALCFEERRWSFAEVAVEVRRVAKGLLAQGIQPGEKVGIWMLNRPEWMFAMFAAMRIGAVLVPINTRFRTADVEYVLGQSDATTLILADRSGPIDYLAMAREVIPALRNDGGSPGQGEDLSGLSRTLLLSERPHAGTVHWPDLLAAGEGVSDAALRERSEAVHPDDTAFFFYTSGTTGFPKGVMHSHIMIRNVSDRANRLAITEHDTIMNYLPLFHAFGFTEGLLTSMVSGARQVLTATFDPEESLELIERERATIVHGFDFHFKELLDAQARSPRDLSSFRTGILAAGMASSVPIARRACREIGPTVSGYGMSEFGVGAALSALDSTEEQRCEASGYPAAGYELRIVDPATGEEQPPGTPGEIWVRGYTVMQGYYNKPEATAETLDADGWIHSGDMGLIRADGHLRFMGRYKDMLKIGGENVDPMEVEAFLMSHPAVNTAAVVGLPDDKLSEVAVAFVLPEPGHSPAAEEVIAHCKGKVASFKIPRHVIFVEERPMTGSGKIQKVKLRERAQRELKGA